MVQGLWGRQIYTIIDVKLGDADADSYKYEPMVALLERWETIKKYKHNKHCHDQQNCFRRLFSQRTGCWKGSPRRNLAIELSHDR